MMRKRGATLSLGLFDPENSTPLPDIVQPRRGVLTLAQGNALGC